MLKASNLQNKLVYMSVIIFHLSLTFLLWLENTFKLKCVVKNNLFKSVKTYTVLFVKNVV